jgi:hypothetical protein
MSFADAVRSSNSPLQRFANRSDAAAYEISPSPSAVDAEELPNDTGVSSSTQNDLLRNWGAEYIQERAVPAGTEPLHFFVPFDPSPNAVQMEMTKSIWKMVPAAKANQFHIPPTGVDSAWIDAAAAAMFTASSCEVQVEIGLIVATDYSHEKLRILAAMGAIASWWWMREGLVWTLLQQPLDGGVYRVDDSTMVGQWQFATNMVQARVDMQERDAVER